MSPKPDEDDIFTSSTSSASNLNGNGTDATNVPLAGGVMSSTGSMRAHLQSLMRAKEMQIQHAGTLGQRVLAQQLELDNLIRELQDVDADRDSREEPSAEMRLRYRDLTKTLDAWDDENAKLTNAFGSGPAMADDLSASTSQPNTADQQQAHAQQSTSASQSRRAKNAAHRANDVGACVCQYFASSFD